MNEKNNGIFSQLTKEVTLKGKVKFLALGKQNTNTQPPKNNSYNGEIDKKFANYGNQTRAQRKKILEETKVTKEQLNKNKAENNKEKTVENKEKQHDREIGD